ncbi:MAG: PqqD family protein [Thermoanaerobaculia bacterium]|nr:PqqD family protein [Thermoanaerobaculia bacterium]
MKATTDHLAIPSRLTPSPQTRGLQRVRTSKHVRSSVEADGAVLLDLHSGKYFSLSEVGSQIWSCLEAGAGSGSIAAEEIVQWLSERYEIDVDLLRGDVQSFLAHLLEKGLIDVT